MILKAVVQKKSSKQSLSKVSSEAVITRFSSTFFYFKIFFSLKISQQKSICVGVYFQYFQVGKETATQVFSCESCEIFKSNFFIKNLGCFCQFDKVIVQ